MARAKERVRVSSGERTVGQISTLLQQALQLLDELGDRPALGARLQEVIDGLENSSIG